MITSYSISLAGVDLVRNLAKSAGMSDAGYDTMSDILYWGCVAGNTYAGYRALMPKGADLIRASNTASGTAAGASRAAKNASGNGKTSSAAQSTSVNDKPKLVMNLQLFSEHGKGTSKGVSKPEFSQLNKVYSNIEDIRSRNKSLVYDERTLRRMSEDVGPYHNIPNSLDKSIISNEPYVIRADGRVEFLKKGTVNGKDGVYHMTIQNNLVKHKLFTPQNDWARFSKRWGLPGYDLID